ncbi:MAG: glycine cleavage system protein T [Robiginitomaculum sp.]|nr:MAG: glycine cleavage system protein T [Robiginitomaculum sp.]
MMQNDGLKRTPLASLLESLGGKMVPFVGYAMPVQFPDGILKEHKWTRTNCGLFDVSHMGQAFVVGPDHETTARALEALMPGNFVDLKPGQQRYSLLLTDDGGIMDDLMVTRSIHPHFEGWLMLVVNAAFKEVDFAQIASRLPTSVRLETAPDRALIAIQGPKTAAVMAPLCDDSCDMVFMQSMASKIGGIDCHISRSGYTGEDGFEISVKSEYANDLARLLLKNKLVKPIGLGARDSLRLEAGLCLSGHDFDETRTPVEASLSWAIPKVRREAGGFPGAARILRELSEGTTQKRVGIKPLGRAPARGGTQVHQDGVFVGEITSGGFGPTFGGPVAMGYVRADLAVPGTKLELMVRGKAHPAEVVKLPFVPQNYYRG